MPSPRDPRRRRPVTVIAVAVLVVVALVLFVVAQLLGGGSKAAAPRDKPTSKAAPTSSSSCNLPDGNQAVPTKGPAAQWVLVAGFAEPRSQAFGPGDRSGDVGSCFARNPSGAIFAVANYFGDSVAPGRDRNRLVARFHDDANKHLAVEQISTTPPKGGLALQIAAFRVTDYTSDRATVELVFRMTEGPHVGQLAATEVTVAWQNGDWRIVAPPTGKYATTSLASSSGYTKWSGA